MNVYVVSLTHSFPLYPIFFHIVTPFSPILLLYHSFTPSSPYFTHALILTSPSPFRAPSVLSTPMSLASPSFLHSHTPLPFNNMTSPAVPFDSILSFLSQYHSRTPSLYHPSLLLSAPPPPRRLLLPLCLPTLHPLSATRAHTASEVQRLSLSLCQA